MAGIKVDFEPNLLCVEDGQKDIDSRTFSEPPFNCPGLVLQRKSPGISVGGVASGRRVEVSCEQFSSFRRS